MKAKLLRKLRREFYIEYDRDDKSFKVHTPGLNIRCIKTLHEAKSKRDYELLKCVRYNYRREKRFKQLKI